MYNDDELHDVLYDLIDDVYNEIRASSLSCDQLNALYWDVAQAFPNRLSATVIIKFFNEFTPLEREIYNLNSVLTSKEYCILLKYETKSSKTSNKVAP